MPNKNNFSVLAKGGAAAFGLALALSFLALPAAFAFDADPKAPKLKLLQDYQEELTRDTELDIKDPLAVFDFVMSSLPERVKVYPTENYFYFTFMHKGVAYAGNIRLDASDRDQGYVHFAYFEEYAFWRAPDDPSYRHLSASDGMTIEKLGKFSYRVSFRGKSVIFDLNDLSEVKPPEGMLNPNETYLGPIYDESGIQFYLIFNNDLKIFHYLLNEQTSVPEVFDQSKISDRIIIGRRTSFSFYKDKNRDRKILIGVFEGNSQLNNYFDGPFDQLPDNFQEGDALRKAILAVVPEYEGKLDRWGSLPDGSERYAITPYMYYASEEDLAFFEKCVSEKDRPAERYYACFNVELDALNQKEGDHPEEGQGQNKTGDAGAAQTGEPQ